MFIIEQIIEKKTFLAYVMKLIYIYCHENNWKEDFYFNCAWYD